MIQQLKALARVPLSPARALGGVLSGRALMYPEFGSQTVDREDISLARSLIAGAKSWSDERAIRSFEKSFASWNGSLGARSFMGGRVALTAAIAALQLKAGDEVVIPAYTCVVVPNAFSFAGIAVRFCDVELETFGPDIDALQRSISSGTRAILVQHLYGLVARDLEKILELARRKRIHVIEDCAHAMGAVLHGRKVGTFGDIGFYSTEQSKVISTFNGGVAATNNPELLQRLDRFQRASPFPSNGRIQTLLTNFVLEYQLQKNSWRWLTSEFHRYRHRQDILQSTTEEELNGIRPAHYGQRMPSPLAELALSQMKKIDAYNQLRRANAAHWARVCEERRYKAPLVIEGSVPIYLRYPVMVPASRKQDVRWCLREFGVKPGVWFTGELHPVARPMPGCPNARQAVERCINLPTLGLET
ncbi:MAG: aminotransferase class I/II-fold pyridoxal phosphate-dependent enzyme [Steroidobacteraceae bacterium]